jgi:hypothetical protein
MKIFFKRPDFFFKIFCFFCKFQKIYIIKQKRALNFYFNCDILYNINDKIKKKEAFIFVNIFHYFKRAPKHLFFNGLFMKLKKFHFELKFTQFSFHLSKNG